MTMLVAATAAFSHTNRAPERVNATSDGPVRRVTLASPVPGPSAMEKLADGLAAACAKWGLTMSEEKVGPWTGTRCQAANTRERYEGILGNMGRFFILIGDYESLLILHEYAPRNCISMKPESVVLFAKFKRSEKGSILKNSNEEAVRDVDGNEVVCSGEWIDPSNVDGLRTSVAMLHQIYEQAGEYKDVCLDCKLLPTENSFKGCTAHSGFPRLRRQGNPVESETWRNYAKKNTKAGAEYQRHGCEQLLPSDIRRLRNYLIASNTVEGLKLYLIIIIAVKLFLRSDEFGNIEFSDIVAGMTVVTASGVEALVFRVKGKSDPIPVELFLWEDEDYPEFCGLRHLWVYLFLTGIKGGYLFPTDEELNNMPADGVCQTAESYCTVMSKLQELFATVLCKPDVKLGTHSFRKTAYLFAFWGGGLMDDVMKSGRHKTLEHAQKYKKDALSQKKLADVHNDPMEYVSSNWAPINRETLGNLRQINAPSIPFQKPIAELAKDFIFQKLLIPPTHPQLRDPLFLVNRATEWSRVKDSRATLETVLETLPGQQAAVIRQAFAMRMAEISNAQQLSQLEVLQASPLLTDSSNKKRKRGDDGEDFEDRDKLRDRKKTTREKLLLIVKMWKENEGKGQRKLTEGARKFIQQQAPPVIGCFEHHCNSDPSIFEGKWPSLKHTKFECSGKPDEQCTASASTT